MSLLLTHAPGPQGLRPNSQTYGCAINACAAEGRWERALELLEAAREATRGKVGTRGGGGGSLQAPMHRLRKKHPN